MNGFLEDLKGSFGILSNADVMSYLLRGLMFTLVISVIAIVFSLLLGVALALARAARHACCKKWLLSI